MKSTLIALLETELTATAYGSLPRHIWERALFEPAREFLSRPGKSFRAHAVAAGWRMGGGDPDAVPVELPLLVEILHAGSLIVDDIEDGSATRRGAPALHRLVGVPVALNTGNWLYFWPSVLLGRLGLPAAVELALHHDVQETLLRCHEGQALDLAARVDALAQAEIPEVVACTTARKTGALLRLAMRLGASAAGASEARISEVGELGLGLGITLQQLDDLGGLRGRREKGHEDLAGRRPTWPWAWIAETASPGVFAALIAGLDGDLTTLAGEMARVLGPHGERALADGLTGVRERVRDPVLAAQLRRLEESYG